MALAPPAALAHAVVAKLYQILTNGDADVPAQTDNFFCWNTPGIPIQSADLDFLTTGLPVVTKAAGADSRADKLTPEQRTALSRAEKLARLLDFIPDVTTVNIAHSANRVAPGQPGSLSGEYGNALKMSQVMHTVLPTELTAKMEKFRNLLQQVVKTTDAITGEQVELTVPSPLMQAYNEKHRQYAAAAFDYNARRLNAMATNDSRAVGDWALNANLYRQQVDAAFNEWVIDGHKNDVEQMAAFLSQITQRDMSVLKGQYLSDFEAGRLTSPVSGADFFATSLILGNFATSTGWTSFTFGTGDYERHRSGVVSTTSWPVHAGEGFLGLFGGASRYTGSLDRAQTTITCEITEVPIERQWFRPVFLMSRSWRFDDNNPTVKGKQLCDGASPPAGPLPGYPVSAVFARRVSLTLGGSRAASDFVARQSKNSLSFGPFFLGDNQPADATVSAEGMQLIGFRCHLLPRCPDPDKAIPSNAWV
jgi:hypothetical protein